MTSYWPSVPFNSYHGTAPGAPLVGASDPVSSKVLDILWVGSTYDMASQFQDGEIRRIIVRLESPLIIDEISRQEDWEGRSHAWIADEVSQSRPDCDGVIFVDTVDGMEVGDVAAIFPEYGPDSRLTVDHLVKVVGRRTYDEDIDNWVSGPGFDVFGHDHIETQRAVSALSENPDMTRLISEASGDISFEDVCKELGLDYSSVNYAAAFDLASSLFEDSFPLSVDESANDAASDEFFGLTPDLQ